MSQHSAIAEPTSRKALRDFACMIRSKCNIRGLFFPVMEFLEYVLPELDKEFSLVILSDSEMQDCYGQSCREEHAIYLREDVYNRACEGIGRDRFTVAHEISHYLLHHQGSVRFARRQTDVPAYMNPEWQANTLAAELLMPYEGIRGMTIDDVARECKVSYQAAAIQLGLQR